jgi:maltose 6'-phosphate phosphatase
MQNLSLITINLHCLEEKDIETNKQIIADEIVDRSVDVIFLQEVAQFDKDPIVLNNIKESNYGYQLQRLLEDKGYRYYYAYLPIKSSFGKYDEGVGLLSRYPLSNIEGKYISNIKEYSDWTSRKFLKATIQLENKTMELFTVHLGWDSKTESYLDQCQKMADNITKKDALIGGDFNVAYGSDYYNKTVEMGLIDLYALDSEKQFDYTFLYELDIHKESARIDYIFGTKKYKVLDQEIIFKDPMVSDHFGMYMKIEV